MHAKAKEWDDRNGKRFEDAGVLPMGRPCDWCGDPVNMGYLHYTCTWVELDALKREAEARAAHRRKYGTGRPGTTARVYKKYEKESLTPNPPGDKLGSNKESSHATPPLPSQGQSPPSP